MIDIKVVKELLTQTDEETLSLYLDVNEAHPENQAATPKWSVWAKNQMREIGDGLGVQSVEAWARIRAWVEDYLSQYNSVNKPQARGIVLFAGASYQQAYELPISFENQISFGKPQVAPLLWAIDEYEPYLVAMVDMEKARFFTSYLAALDFQESMEIDLDEYDFGTKPMMPASAGGHEIAAGTNKEAWQRMINEHRRRFYREVADTLVKVADQHQAERIILAGAEDSIPEVYNLLDDRAKARIAGRTAIPMYHTTADIFQQILPLAQEFERQQEMTLVTQVIDFAKSGGRGALGREDVEQALEMQRVETLILPWPISDPAMQTTAENLAFRVLQLNSRIELVHGEPADRLNAEGGIAARLYYAINKD